MSLPGGAAAPAMPPAEEMKRSLTIALVGNPNTGKTTLFNALCGMRQRVGNYAGVTVEIKKGRWRAGGQTHEIIDLPGTYSLAPRSPDEMLTVDLVLGQQAGEKRPDVILSIVDASNLERNLYLTTQLFELGLPVVVALNMIDVAEAQGRQVDAARLQERLGVPVVPVQANRKRGLGQLQEVLLAAAQQPAPSLHPLFPEEFVRTAGGLVDGAAAGNGDGVASAFLLRRALLDVGGHTEKRLAAQYGHQFRERVAAARQHLAEAGLPVTALEAKTRYGWIRERLQGCVARPVQRKVTFSERLDRLITHKLWGTLLFLTLMFIVFQSIFTWAQPLMELIIAGQDWLAEQVRGSMSAGPLRSLLADGVIQGAGSVVVFLPQIVILFGFIAILEDCGYMARAAFLMDKIMSRCGLSGKSFIPMLSSFACAIPGIMSARVIEDRRDRLTTILVAPLMSCSARLPVYTLLIAAFIPTDTAVGIWLPGLVLFCMYLIGIVIAPLVALALKRTLLRGDTPVFVMELPPYKLPSLGMMLHRMYDRGKAFVVRAGTIILASMIVVWALLYFPSTGSGPDGQSFSYEEEMERVRSMVSDEEWRRYAELEQAKEQLAAKLEKASAAGARLLALWDRREDLEAVPEEKRTVDQAAAIEELAKEEARLRREATAHAKAGPLLQELDRINAELAPLAEKIDPVQEEINGLQGEWKRNSLLGKFGHWVEPAGHGGHCQLPRPGSRCGDARDHFQRGRSGGGIQAAAAAPANRHAGRRLRPVHHSGGPFAHGLFRLVQPMRLHLGSHPPRDQQLALAPVHLHLHDRPGVCRGAADVSAGLALSGDAWCICRGVGSPRRNRRDPKGPRRVDAISR